MRPDKEAPPATGPGARDEAATKPATSLATLSGPGDVFAEQVRQLVIEADCAPPCDLVTWAEGYCAGYDAALSGALNARAFDLAETMAMHEREHWLPLGAMSRRRRIARERAEMATHAVAVRQTDDWPRVRVPGGAA